MKKTISSILISFVFFINFFVPFSISLDGKFNKSIVQAGGEKVEINVTTKKEGNLGININGTFTTNIKNDNVDVFYFIVKDLNTYVDNGIFQEKITPEPTIKDVGGEKIYTYSFGQQLYQFSDKKVYYDVVNGDTYFAKVVVLRTPVTGGPQLKYYSNDVEFMAGTPRVEKKDTPEPVKPQIGDVTNKTKYTFLAPLGSIKCMDSSGQDKTCIGNNIGEYLNFIFKFAIGLCAALAVLMLIMAGITYMGDESIFGKTEAKHKMMASIGGLLIALAAWALLNTINPDLTGKNNINITGVSIKLEPTSGGGYYGVTIGSSGGANANKNITEYDSYLKNASQKYGVECTLIKAFMYAESGGVNGLTSPAPANAKGLIQLTDATFREQNVGNDPMNPQTNINAGASYLSKLKNNGCNGNKQSSVCDISNIQYLAASYNGGPGANKESSDCKNATIWQCTNNSGYAQTRTYAPRVEANYNKLKEKGWGC